MNILSGSSYVDAGFCVSLELYLRIELLGCMMTLLSPFRDSFPKWLPTSMPVMCLLHILANLCFALLIIVLWMGVRGHLIVVWLSSLWCRVMLHVFLYSLGTFVPCLSVVFSDTLSFWKLIIHHFYYWRVRVRLLLLFETIFLVYAGLHIFIYLRVIWTPDPFVSTSQVLGLHLHVQSRVLYIF